MLDAFDGALLASGGNQAARRFAVRAIADAFTHGLGRRFRSAPEPRMSARNLQTPRSPKRRITDPPDIAMRNLVWALRSLQRRPTLAIAVILTLTIGIGASTATFSVMDGILFRELPYSEPERLLAVQQRDTRTEQIAAPISPANYLDLRESTTTFEDLAGTLFRAFAPTVRLGEEPAFQAQVLTVTFNLFDVLGAEPFMGRGFSDAEAHPGAPATAILSHDFWTRVFDAANDVLGGQITIAGTQREIIGVMPPGFYVEAPADIWIPMNYDPDVHFALAADIRHIGMLNLVGRLAPDHTPEHADDEMNALFASLGREFPENNAGLVAVVRGAKERQVGDHRRALWLLGAAVGTMLVIAALNMAVLLVASAASRQTEISTRLALGSSRSRLVLQGLTESVLLALAGALGGGLLATFLVRGVLGLMSSALPRQSEIAVDARTWGFGFAVALVTGVLFGLLPLMLQLRVAPIQAMRGRSTASSNTARLRRGLIVAEVALAFVLLIGAGFLLESFNNALRVDPGFDTAGVLTTATSVRESDAETAAGRLGHFVGLREQLLAIPGVIDVGYSSRTPFRGNSVETEFSVEGQPVAQSDQNRAEFRRAGPHYFETLQIPVLEGRTFRSEDRRENEPVMIVNDAARRAFFDGSPVGQRVRWNGSDSWYTVIGVVGDVRHFGLDVPAVPEIYISMTQAPNSSAGVFVRVSGDTGALSAVVIDRVKSANPAEPVPLLQTMESLVDASLLPRKLPALLVSGFGLFALVLSAMGLYGVLAYLVEERSAEIGIRMALGAQPRAMLGSVVKDGVVLAGIGLLVGLPIAILATRSVATMLFDVSANDPLTFVGIAALLLAVAATASVLAGRRATHVDPASTLDRA